MALPIAQLGYMPSINAPSHGGRTIVEDPWAKMAQMVLGQVASQAVGNLMSQDYANQAKTEGIVPNGGPAGDTPDNQPWYKKMLTGPAMNERQYSAAQNRMSERDMQRGQQKFTREEGQKTRDQQFNIEAQRNMRDMAQFQGQQDLAKQRLAQENTQGARNTLLQGRGLAIKQQNADTRANPPLDPDATRTQIARAADSIYRNQLEAYGKIAFSAAMEKKPLPPQPTYEDAYMQASQVIQKMMQLQQQPAVRAPSIPLVDPSMLQFNGRIQ